jgi:hypothetical protein
VLPSCIHIVIQHFQELQFDSVCLLLLPLQVSIVSVLVIKLNFPNSHERCPYDETGFEEILHQPSMDSHYDKVLCFEL